MVGTAIFTFLFKTFVLMHCENWTVCFIFLILLYLIYMFTSKIVVEKCRTGHEGATHGHERTKRAERPFPALFVPQFTKPLYMT